MALGAYYIAEKLRVPAFLGLPIPLITPTRAFPIPLIGRTNLRGNFNKLSYRVLLWSLVAPYQGLINRCGAGKY